MKSVSFALALASYTTFAVGGTFGWAEGARFWQPYLLLQIGLYGLSIGWGSEEVEEMR